MSGHDVGQYFTACDDGDMLTLTIGLATTYIVDNDIEFRLFDQNNILVGTSDYTNTTLPAWIYPQGIPLQEFTFILFAPIHGGQFYHWELSYCCNYVGPNSTANEIICGRYNSSVMPGNAYFTHYNSNGSFHFQTNQIKDISASVEITRHSCYGDFNGDLQIDNSDAIIIAAQYGMPCQNITTDMDGDCDVDDMDFDIFKKLLGNKCN
jgi:hypothetical protein